MKFKFNLRKLTAVVTAIDLILTAVNNARLLRPTTPSTPRPRFNVGDFVTYTRYPNTAMLVIADIDGDLSYAQRMSKYGVLYFVCMRAANAAVAADQSCYTLASAEAIEAARLK